jgi:hypothetical protein
LTNLWGVKSLFFRKMYVNIRSLALCRTIFSLKMTWGCQSSKFSQCSKFFLYSKSDFVSRILNGRMPEWFIGAVLKTVVGQPTEGSNPSPSAIIKKEEDFSPLLFFCWDRRCKLWLGCTPRKGKIGVKFS